MLAYLDTCIAFAVVMLVMSLLITIMTQMVSALVNHRGSNLLWGIKTLFANIDPRRFPQLKEKSEWVAREALTHCLVSDSWFSGNKVAQSLGAKIPLLQRLFTRFQLASSIRPSELREILTHLSENKLADTAVAQEIFVLLRKGQSAVGTVTGGGAIGIAVAAGPAGQALQTANFTAGELEDWFNSMMDRVSQKFTMYMRIWTVAFAALIAFGTGLNAFRLLSDLYSNGAFRSALVGAGRDAINSAGRVLDAKNALGATYAASLDTALKSAGVTPATPPPSGFATTQAVSSWIAGNLPQARQADVQRRFDGVAIEASQAFIQRSVEDATKISAVASSAGFDMLQYRWPANPDMRDVLGVFLTAGLLSLGAPFWFNALKSMTNLRSVVAAKQDPGQGQPAA